MPVLSESQLATLVPAFLRNPDDPPAPCTVDPEAWFPVRGAFSRENVIALSICHSCPYREPCREAGFDGNEDGVWGGETSHERTRRRGRTRGEKSVAARREQINRDLTRAAQQAAQRR